jgi:hypothetical protein
MGTLSRLNVVTVAALLLVMAAGAGSARAQDVVDPSAGYTLAVPDGWDAIPDGPLGRAKSLMFKPGAANAPNFVAGFEPSGHKTYFEYPYVLVQVQSYGQNLSLGTISRSELEEMVAKLTGVPAAQFKKTLSTEVASALRDASIDAPTLLSSPPGLVMGSTLNVRGVGTVRGRSVCLLGRTNAVMVHFYAKDDDWDQCADVAEQFADGFHRTPDQSVILGDVTSTTSGERVGAFDWNKVGGKALVGGIVVGVAGLFGLVKWKSGRSTPAGE